MAPIPSESALLASLQAGLVHWKTFSTAANTQPEQALHDWFAKDAIATAGSRKCTLCAASSATIVFSASTTYEKQLRIEKTRLSHQVWSHGGSTFKKKGH